MSAEVIYCQSDFNTDFFAPIELLKQKEYVYVKNQKSQG